MSDPDSLQLHATCVAIDGRGIVLRGPSGSGKSDLALRLIDEPGYGLGGELLRGELIGDDQIILTRRDSSLIASPPNRLAGLLEIRGTGIIGCPHVTEAAVELVVDLYQKDTIERFPDDQHMVFEALGISVRRIAVDAHLPSAAARVRAGLMASRRDPDDRCT